MKEFVYCVIIVMGVIVSLVGWVWFVGVIL